jgi:2-methylcitrate dehydratase PrpD
VGRALTTHPLAVDLARYVASSCDRPLDERTATAARRGVLDWCGVAVAGSLEPAAKITAELVADLGGAAQATIVGRADRASTPHAALANGTAGHALDFDDTHVLGAVHATGTVLPAALALAEARGASSAELFRAYATGFEVAAFLGELLYPIHHEAAWHASAVFGTIGAACASSVLLRLDEDRIADAIAIASTGASGLRALFGTMGKPFHAGKAASTGLLAALLAEKGFQGSDTVMEDRHGLLRMLGAKGAADLASVGELEGWSRIQGNDFKLHACCHATHAAVDAAIAIRAGHAMVAADIERVTVRCSPILLTVAANPAPRTGLEAKFSVAYCVLTALLMGDASMARFTDGLVLSSPVRELLPRVVLEVADRYSPLQAALQVDVASGASYRSSISAPKGSSLAPASWEELSSKFHSLADPILGAAACSRLASAIGSMPEGPLSTVLAGLRPAPSSLR